MGFGFAAWIHVQHLHRCSLISVSDTFENKVLHTIPLAFSSERCQIMLSLNVIYLCGEKLESLTYLHVWGGTATIYCTNVRGECYFTIKKLQWLPTVKKKINSSLFLQTKRKKSGNIRAETSGPLTTFIYKWVEIIRLIKCHASSSQFMAWRDWEVLFLHCTDVLHWLGFVHSGGGLQN